MKFVKEFIFYLRKNSFIINALHGMELYVHTDIHFLKRHKPLGRKIV